MVCVGGFGILAGRGGDCMSMGQLSDELVRMGPTHVISLGADSL